MSRADVQIDPQTDELFVADGYGNHRVAVFDGNTGNFKRMWGAFGNKPVDADSCPIIGYKEFEDPGPPQFSIVHAIRVAKDGMVYVADRENRRVQEFSSTALRQSHARRHKKAMAPHSRTFCEYGPELMIETYFAASTPKTRKRSVYLPFTFSIHGLTALVHTFS